jgi:hypothetical protein
MTKTLLRHILVLMTFSVYAQTVSQSTKPSLLRYIGQYETNGFAVHVTLHHGRLVLVVPGSPIQNLIWLEGNKFRSDSFDDAVFTFSEVHGEVVGVVSQGGGNSVELTRISNAQYRLDATDSLLTMQTSTNHFTFLYSEIDSLIIGQLAVRLEKDYDKILADFALDKLPKTTVRVYPDKSSFHRGINYPDGPEDLLATAFGKDDFRMTSPNSVKAEDSLLLVKMITHEFTHCVHLNIVYAPNNPRWLWESIANFEAGWFVDPTEIEIVRKKEIPPLSNLNGLEYQLGYVIIEAMKDIWGFEKVVQLIKERGDVQSVFHLSPQDFENRVYEQIYQKYLR